MKITCTIDLDCCRFAKVRVCELVSGRLIHSKQLGWFVVCVELKGARYMSEDEGSDVVEEFWRKAMNQSLCHLVHDLSYLLTRDSRSLVGGRICL